MSSGSGLADPRLWRDLAHTVRRRIDHIEVEDVVQATLAEALAAKALPTAEEGVRRFVFAIARQKVADVYRRRDRDRRRALKDCAPIDVAPPNDLHCWLERILPKAPSTQQTFDWMLREADGETLAEIAATDRVSAPMVRQRVSRLRRWLRARWAKDVGTLTVLAIVALALGLSTLRREGKHQRIVAEQGVASTQPVPAPSPSSEPDPPIEIAPAPMGIVTREPSAPLLPRRLPPAPKSTTTTSPRRYVQSASSEKDWEAAVPSVDVHSCATPSSPRGIGHITLAIRGDGSVESAVVDAGELVGRPEARCVERLYEGLQLWRAPERTRAVVAHGHRYFTFGSEAPASFLR